MLSFEETEKAKSTPFFCTQIYNINSFDHKHLRDAISISHFSFLNHEKKCARVEASLSPLPQHVPRFLGLVTLHRYVIL